jgi:hypothetical protein
MRSIVSAFIHIRVANSHKNFQHVPGSVLGLGFSEPPDFGAICEATFGAMSAFSGRLIASFLSAAFVYRSIKWADGQKARDLHPWVWFGVPSTTNGKQH